MSFAARIALSSFLLIASLACCAQQPWSIGARGHYGYLWPHRPNAWILVQGHAPAFEVFAERTVHGDRPWHQRYRMPRYGLLVLGTNMANPSRIGTCIGVIPYLRLDLVNGKRSSFGLRFGWGLGYVAKPYDRIENPHQIAIGSGLNIAVQIMPEWRMDLGRTAMHFGLAVDHWSNGSFAIPNLGLNFLSVAAGVSYALHPPPVHMPLVDSTAYERPYRELLVLGAFSLSETGRALNGRSPVVSLVADASWRKGHKGVLSAGIDVFNKGDLATVNASLADASRLSLTQVGVHGGGALLMGRAELLLQIGAYVVTPVPDDAVSYQRIGGRYRIGDHLVAGIALKTHFAAADHWEFGIGYRWN